MSSVASADPREGVVDAVGRGELGERLRGVERRVELAARIAVEHEARAQVGPGRPEQLQPVFLGSRQGPLVRKDDALREGDEPYQREKSAPLRGGARGLTGRAKRLVIAVECGLVVANEDPLGAPAREDVRGIRVLGVPFPFREDEPHDIVRVPGGELGPLRRRDDVVGRCDHGPEACLQAREVVAERGQGCDFGHGCPRRAITAV
jgi:hypothetical protein